METSFIKIEPLTKAGQWLVAKRVLAGGKYNVICSCRWESHADIILQALRNDEFTSKIADSIRK